MKKLMFSLTCTMLLFLLLAGCSKKTSSVTNDNTSHMANRITASIPLTNEKDTVISEAPTNKIISAPSTETIEKSQQGTIPNPLNETTKAQQSVTEEAKVLESKVEEQKVEEQKVEEQKPEEQKPKEPEPKTEEKPKETKEKKEEKTEEKKKPAIISSFITKYNPGNKGRTANIKIASKKINGAVVKPGEVFSYNGRLGPVGEAAGYKLATVFIDGKEEKGFGGGVCQLSSTIFNACKKAGLKIVERHPHSLPVSYVKKGQDATTSQQAGKDFRFKNTFDYPITIRVSAAKGKLSVSLEKA